VCIAHQATTCVSAIIGVGTARASLEWAVGSEFRFFPAVPDRRFGRVLHPMDVAAAKLIAAASAPKVRDAFDLL
jgi:hypothetical protein